MPAKQQDKSTKQTAMVYDGQQLSTLVPPWRSNLFTEAPHGELAEYTEMLERDYAAREALAFASNIIINLIGEYEHEDQRLEAFVRQALEQMRGTWAATLRRLLKAQVYGFAVVEKIWGEARIAGRASWVYDALIPIKPESLAVKGIVMERALGQPQEIVQWRQYGEGQAIHIPGAKVAHWSLDDMGDGYGTPLGRAMLPLYRAKKSTQEAWQVAATYRGYPQIYEVVPGGMITDAQNQEKSYAAVAGETWGTVKSGGVIIRPSPPGDWGEKGLPRVEVLQGAAFGQEFSSHIDWVDKAYHLCVGIPALVVMESQYGTRAQSAVHTDAAKFGMLPLAEEFVESCLMRDLVRPLVEANFGEQEDYGTFSVALPLDEARFAEILSALNQAGVVQMNVPWRTYDHLQRQLPDYLPVVEEPDYYEESPQTQAQTALPSTSVEPLPIEEQQT